MAEESKGKVIYLNPKQEELLERVKRHVESNIGGETQLKPGQLVEIVANYYCDKEIKEKKEE